jgi:predicted ATPase
MLYGWSEADPAKRKGAINFVVGVNGTGKSTLLRAIYRGLRALSLGNPPPLPMTLAWDRRVGPDPVTAIFHLDGQNPDQAFFTAQPHLSDALDAPGWSALIAAIAETAGDYQGSRVERGSDAWSGSYLLAHLPRRIIGYTTGAELLWAELERTAFRPDWDLADPADGADRPPGWTIELEAAQEILPRYREAAAGVSAEAPVGSTRLSLGGPGWVEPILGAKRDDDAVQARLSTARGLVAGTLAPATRICPADLRLVAIALALWQAARELYGRRVESEQAALRRQCLETPAASGDPARRILNVLDWFLPTHLSLVYRADADGLDGLQRDRLGCLLALAETVAVQPLGRYRTVIPLGAQGFGALTEQLDERFPSLFIGTSREPILTRISGCHSGAEAVIRVFSDAQAPHATGADALEPTLLEVFEALRNWQAAGLLEEVNLTIKRLHRVTASDGEPDDAIVTFDQLSDGEQMLLGRVALLHLVRGQDGALLLLDEPETHFNDVWKRELIDLIDDVILKETFAQVLVSTHTSIALTDVFSSEVVRLLWRDDRLVAESPAFPTFGADPGRILMHVFGSPEVIGRRAAEFLREKLKQEWTASNREELARLVDEIGSGWPRAKLAEILLRLDAPSGS